MLRISSALHWYKWGLASIGLNIALFVIAHHHPSYLGGYEIPPGDVGEMPPVLKIINYPFILLVSHSPYWPGARYAFFQSIVMLLLFCCYWYLLGALAGLLFKLIRKHR